MTDLSLSRSQMLLLSGTANRALSEEVAAHLGQPLCQVTIRRFADGDNVNATRGRDEGIADCDCSVFAAQPRPDRRRRFHRSHRGREDVPRQPVRGAAVW